MMLIKFILILSWFLVSNTVFSAPVFFEKSAALGIEFSHEDERNGAYHMTETAGGGLGWFDYNNDGLIDLFLVGGINGNNKLYKNTGNEFVDVSVEMRVVQKGHYSMGVCSADINQDGWIDFALTAHGNDKIFINQGGKTFKQKNIDAKAQSQQWSSSCAFADLDNDGDVDLYVARYAVFDLNGNKSCIVGDGYGDNKGYCNPKHYPGGVDGIYINDGKGHFTKLDNGKRGLYTGRNDHGYGVVISDFDQDKDMDIFVANDTTENRLYINDGKGYFQDMGLLSGTALNFNGVAESGMGIGMADVDRNGHQDLMLTHFSMETNTLYHNFGEANFADMTQPMGLNTSSFMSMGWGIAFVDVNNNGYDDLLVANGHINEFIHKVDNRQSYKQKNQLFLNEAGKKLIVQPYEQSFSTTTHYSSRGLATADWNNDGKIDVAISNNNEVIEVFENTHANNHQWLGIALVGPKTNRSAIGAVVTLKSGNMAQRKEVISGGSFMSQSDFRLLFGMAKHKAGVKISVQWPDGQISSHDIQQLNRYHTITYLQQ